MWGRGGGPVFPLPSRNVRINHCLDPTSPRSQNRPPLGSIRFPGALTVSPVSEGLHGTFKGGVEADDSLHYQTQDASAVLLGPGAGRGGGAAGRGSWGYLRERERRREDFTAVGESP